MNSYKLTIVPAGKIYPLAGKVNLLDVIRREGISLESPCSGKGTCGKCRIQIIIEPGYEKLFAKCLSFSKLN